MKKYFVSSALWSVLFALSLQPSHAFAQHYDGPGPWHGYGPWHGDIYHFHDYDFDRWRHGSWFQGPHEGRYGWWWIIDDQWYFYPAPVYPYPDPFSPPGVAVAPGGGSYFYYCRHPEGYYPYVPACYGHWHPVVSEAPPSAPPPVVVEPSPPPPPVAPLQAPPSVSLPSRDEDDRQLNAYAVELSHINPKGQHAAARLKDLQHRVEAFHESLFERGYNAMDILKDTEDLQKRIAAERANLPPP